VPTRIARVSIVVLCGSMWFASGVCRASNRTETAPTTQGAAQEQSAGESLGDLQMVEKHYVAAIDDYRSVATPSAVVLNKIGVAYHHLYGFGVAKTYYKRALLLDPKFSPALNNLGAIFYSQENYKAAEKMYRKAIKNDPRSAKAYKNLGTAYFAQGKISRGVEQYRAAFALDPEMFVNDDAISEPTSDDNRAIEYYALARLFAEAGKEQVALAYLTKALAAGFSDKNRLMRDQEFAGMRNMPEFERLATKL
jgi:tetratricopeptide (TPR) repeat protein